MVLILGIGGGSVAAQQPAAPGTSAPGTSASSASTNPTITLEDLLDRVDDSIEVRRAAIACETALKEVDRAALRADPTLSLSPGIRADGYEDSREADRWAATFSVSGTIATGLSDDQLARLERARDNAAIARIELDQTRFDQSLRVVRLYHAAWLRHREIQVLEAEVAGFAERARIDRLRFEQGEIAWDELLRTESEYREHQAELSDVVMSHRSAILDLALEVGVEPERLAALATPPGITGDRPTVSHPPADSSVITSQKYALAAAMRDASYSPGILSQTTVRLGVDAGDHSASLSYAVNGPALSLSYSPAPFVIAESSGDGGASGGSGSGSSDYDWTMSLGITIGLTGIRGDRVEQETHLLAVDREEALLAYLHDRETMQLEEARSRVTQADRDVEITSAAVTRADATLAIVQARMITGQVTEMEVAQAEVSLKRAMYNLERAILNLEEARLDVERFSGSTSR